MGKFVYFTSAEKRQANEVDLPSFLRDRGEKLLLAGREYRLASDHSITVRGAMWYPAGWLEHSYVACCGTSIQPVLERLRQNPKLDTVYLCLDNDEAGEDACDGMLDTLEDMGYDVERLRPEGKDWNDDLRAKRGGHG